MRIELLPASGSDDPDVRAAAVALAREGLAHQAGPRGSAAAWRRAGLLEAVEKGVARRLPARARADGPARAQPAPAPPAPASPPAA